MLTRIYGITFPKKSMLDEYLALLEEAKKRDHRKLGKELELFCFSPRVGAGSAAVAAQGRRAERPVWSTSCAMCRRDTATCKSSRRTSA